MRLLPVFDDRDVDGLARHFESIVSRWDGLDDTRRWELTLLAREACRWFEKNPPNFRSDARREAEDRARRADAAHDRGMG